MTEEKSLENFLVGESVKVIDGPFCGFVAVVNEINQEKRRVKLGVKIFGRMTPIELEFSQIDKDE